MTFILLAQAPTTAKLSINSASFVSKEDRSMNDHTPVLQLPPTMLPALPKLSEVTKTFWIELLGLGGNPGNLNPQDDIGGKPWK